MRKLPTLLAAVAMASMTVAMAMPAQAADNDVASMAKTAAWFPVQVAGTGTAWLFGTPICVARRTTVRIREFTREGADKIGGHEHFPPVLFASLLTVPMGTVAGVGEGVYYGGRNAFNHGFEHPFSLDSFSLGDDVEK